MKTDHVQLFVLDEADEMLSRGFKEQIYDVFRYMPETVQCTIFSATMPLEVLEVTSKFMRGTLSLSLSLSSLSYHYYYHHHCRHHHYHYNNHHHHHHHHRYHRNHCRYYYYYC